MSERIEWLLPSFVYPGGPGAVGSRPAAAVAAAGAVVGRRLAPSAVAGRRSAPLRFAGRLPMRRRHSRSARPSVYVLFFCVCVCGLTQNDPHLVVYRRINFDNAHTVLAQFFFLVFFTIAGF